MSTIHSGGHFQWYTNEIGNREILIDKPNALTGKFLKN